MLTWKTIDARFVLAAKESRCTYQECFGSDAWADLPEAVRTALSCPMRAEGKADVVNGTSWISKLVARCMHLPKEGKDRVLDLETSWDGDTIVWRRVFSGRALVSRQTIEPGRLTESFGLSRIEFAAETDGSKVIFTSGRVKVLGITLPRALRPVTIATIQASGDGWESSVSISVPLFGLLCKYIAQTEKK